MNRQLILSELIIEADSTFYHMTEIRDFILESYVIKPYKWLHDLVDQFHSHISRLEELIGMINQIIQKSPKIEKLEETLRVVSSFIDLKIIDGIPIVVYNPKHTFVSLMTNMSIGRRRSLLDTVCKHDEYMSLLSYITKHIVQGPYKHKTYSIRG